MNDDLISRSALMEDIEQLVVFTVKTGQPSAEIRGANKIVARIEAAPAVDAVEVVRCKDCKWLYNGLDMYCCTKHTGLALITPDGSGFCSYGERRADDATD